MRGVRIGAALPPLCLGFACTAAVADVVSLRELAVPDGVIADARKVAADGTVVGNLFGGSAVARWQPDGRFETIDGPGVAVPQISTAGSVIAATCVFPDSSDPERPPVVSACFWRGGTAWDAIGATVLKDLTLEGMSDDGGVLAGSGFLDEATPPDDTVRIKPWVWSAAHGQRVLAELAEPPEMLNGIATAVSNDGSVAAGYVVRDFPDVFERHAVIWDAAGVRRLRDDEGRPVGYATACNSDCSVVIGAGHFVDGGGSSQAWRWSAQTGVEYLGEAPGAQPAMPYFAYGLSEDGTTIVGTYSTTHPDGYLESRPFIWTRQHGMVDMTDFLATHGIAYGADYFGAINAVTRDGRHLLFNGYDVNYQRQRALIRIAPDAIFAHGFDPD